MKIVPSTGGVSDDQLTRYYCISLQPPRFQKNIYFPTSPPTNLPHSPYTTNNQTWSLSNEQAPKCIILLRRLSSLLPSPHTHNVTFIGRPRLLFPIIQCQGNQESPQTPIKVITWWLKRFSRSPSAGGGRSVVVVDRRKRGWSEILGTSRAARLTTPAIPLGAGWHAALIISLTKRFRERCSL